jgi:hypothetical protein
MSARARARAIEAIEIETEMDIAMLSEADETDKALPLGDLLQLASRQVERTRFLVDQGEVPVWVWVDAWLRRGKLREFLKAKAKAEGRRVMWLEE